MAEHDPPLHPVALAEPLPGEVRHRSADQLETGLAVARQLEIIEHPLESSLHRIDRHIEARVGVEQRRQLARDRHDRPVLLRLLAPLRVEVERASVRMPLIMLAVGRDVVRRVRPRPGRDADLQEAMEVRPVGAPALVGSVVVGLVRLRIGAIAEHGGERGDVGAVGGGAADLARLLRREAGREQRVLPPVREVDRGGEHRHAALDGAGRAGARLAAGRDDRHLHRPFAEPLDPVFIHILAGGGELVGLGQVVRDVREAVAHRIDARTAVPRDQIVGDRGGHEVTRAGAHELAAGRAHRLAPLALQVERV
ncbi:hypothetical protein [Sphingomonas sanxanigenens]|uniref:hypothetical protein n=1 Tax=Sphingomonas sanxanigenens TaxID=397260 RepID=UPI0013012CC1|nr:hypothetical protein [Sphingomonas sanxanigenens]